MPVTPNVPKNITFTLEGKPIPGAKPLPRPAEAPADAPPTPPVFGPEYGGAFTFRYPRANDRLKIAGAITRAWEQLGVDDPSRVPPLELTMQRAFAFFEVLGTAVPDWFTPEAPDGQLFQTAVIAALGAAEEEIVAAKKKSDGSGGSS